jgi:hypothetical protein
MAASLMTMANATTAATEGTDVITTALVAYLRSEADLAEQKAASLRAQAAALAAQYGLTDELLHRYGRCTNLCIMRVAYQVELP